jgi:hypothetical protein
MNPFKGILAAVSFVYAASNIKKRLHSSTNSSAAVPSSKLAVIDVPVVDFSLYFSREQKPEAYQAECNSRLCVTLLLIA